jgi:hypothetical protein
VIGFLAVGCFFGLPAPSLAPPLIALAAALRRPLLHSKLQPHVLQRKVEGGLSEQVTMRPRRR